MNTARVIEAVCINLDRKPERWQRMQREMAREFPVDDAGLTLRLRRQSAVDGERDLSDPEKLSAVLSPYALHAVRNRRLVCDRLQINSLAAVGCSLSHIACWEWLVAHPEVRWLLILEDDVCAAGLRTLLTETLRDVLSGDDTDSFDFLVL